MNLHRSTSEGQWSQVAPIDQNIYQKVAERTNGFVTPANAVSLAGAGLVLAGLQDVNNGDVGRGVVKIGLGRAADLLDGTVAARTGTISPVGEAVDAVADKVVMAVALPTLTNKGILPVKATSIIFAQSTASAFMAARAKLRNEPLQPSAAGKLATFSHWATIGLHSISAAAAEAKRVDYVRRLEMAADISTAMSIVFGAQALRGYAHRSKEP